MFISNEKINLIRLKNNIVDIISKYLKLKQKGKNFWAICPFHSDHRESMSISFEKQIYYCFVCLSGGNVFTFLQKFKNITFIEAIKELANIININIDELKYLNTNKINNPIHAKIFMINNLINNFFINNLNTQNGKKAQKYLKFRKITQQQIEKFMIGYADNKKDSLSNFLIKKKYSLNEIIKTGVVYIRNNKIYDYFNDRIIFPILDDNNNIIGFSRKNFVWK